MLKENGSGLCATRLDVKDKWLAMIPDVLLALLVVYVAVLGVATFDELLGWKLITPYLK